MELLYDRGQSGTELGRVKFCVENKIVEYSETVCSQVRWKGAHPLIKTEIEGHLYEQSESFFSQGMDQEAAIKAALNEMGDPVLVGSELNKVYRPDSQKGLVALILVLIAVGVRSRWGGTGLDLAWCLLSVGAFLAVYVWDFSIWGKYLQPLSLIAGGAALVLTLAAKYWDDGLGGETPLVHLALLAPLGFSAVLYGLRGKKLRGASLSGLAYGIGLAWLFWLGSISGIVLFSCVAIPVFGTAAKQNWFGLDRKKSGIIFCVGLLSMAGMAGVCLLCFPGFVMSLNIAFMPQAYADGQGYLSCQIRSLLSDAGLVGADQGNSALLAAISPAMFETDFFLTRFIYQYGWCGFALMVCLLALLFWKMASLVRKQRSMLGRLLTKTILLTLGVQTGLYLAYNLGFTLFLPLSLPFLSYGNAALFCDLFLAGVMLSVFRGGKVYLDSIGLNGKKQRGVT